MKLGGLFVCISVVFPLTAWSASPAGDPVCARSAITLRKGPSSSQPVSWRVAKYMPFLKMESKSSWTKVQDVDGESHWAQSKDLSSSLSCVVVRTQVATLRKGPDKAAEPTDLKTVDKFTPFKKLELDGDWVKVEDETGREGWIHQTNVWRPVKVQSMTF